MRNRLIVGVFAATLVAAASFILWKWSAGGNGDIQKILTDNGFIELRPPSTLIEPGAWVEVQARNPLRLRTVCSAKTALDLSVEQLTKSTSANTSLTRALTGNFTFSLESLAFGNLSARAQTIETVELRLSNVRLIELADDQILRNLPKRDKHCAEAIRLRYENDSKSLTMIDTVLIADAEYHFTFKGQANADANIQAVQELAAKGNLSVDASRNTVVLGSSLVWGVKDNQFMASRGIGLPNVGASTTERSILRDSGPIAVVEPLRLDRPSLAGALVLNERQPREPGGQTNLRRNASSPIGHSDLINPATALVTIAHPNPLRADPERVLHSSRYIHPVALSQRCSFI